MRVAVYAGTRNLYEDMVSAAKSLIWHTAVDRVYFLVEDDQFPYWLPDCVETINVSGQQYFRPDGPNYHTGWTYMVLMRAALHRVFPDLDTILSLDVDTIVKRDISDLWDLPIDNYWLAGAPETYKSELMKKMYINCGVMLLNLKKLRDDGKGDEIIEALNTKYYQFNEQDCIAERCQGGILKMPSDYNVNNYTERPFKEKIIHLAAIRNWRDHPFVTRYREIPWEVIMKSRI